MLTKVYETRLTFTFKEIDYTFFVEEARVVQKPSVERGTIWLDGSITAKEVEALIDDLEIVRAALHTQESLP